MLVYLILALNVGISIWAFSAFNKGRDPERFLFLPYFVARGKNLQGALLSQFSHADLGHLIFNMITLLFFGPVVEGWLGLHFLTVYVLSGLAATALVFALRFKDPDHRVLGASGAITGVLFAAIVLAPGMRISFLIVPVPIPAPLFAALYLGLSTFLMSRGDVSRTSHEAHLGGALAGFALGALLAPGGLAPLLNRIQDFFR